MGSTKVLGWFITKVLQVNQFKLPQTQGYYYLQKELQSVTNYYTNYKYTQDTKVQEV
jgi:hypothetical protein